jgi:hypothetical protein
MSTKRPFSGKVNYFGRSTIHAKYLVGSSTICLEGTFRIKNKFGNISSAQYEIYVVLNK